MGVDSSENFDIIGIVVGDFKTLQHFYMNILRIIREEHLHVSKLKRDKKRKLLRYIESARFPFVAVCIKTKFRSRSRTIAMTTYMPRKKAQHTLMKMLLSKARNILKKENIDKLEAIHLDREFIEYEDLFVRVFGTTIAPRNFATELADLIAYLNRVNMEENITVIEF